MIAAGDRLWWWDGILGLWELFDVADVPPDPGLVQLIRGDGRRQLARRENIPGETYRLPGRDQFFDPLCWDYSGCQGALSCAA